jgi:hypothetical protein
MKNDIIKFVTVKLFEIMGRKLVEPALQCKEPLHQISFTLE